ncbi:hypothetical protein [Sphingomonas yabuuchiae]|uniref:hypothetical protein n=1 Tax=Sphingomonas yabuuchiae TaxID=172044 RepID=UPI00128EB8FE|nr:hypothetical protein [Sphingomonas yabuuchiae]
MKIGKSLAIIQILLLTSSCSQNIPADRLGCYRSVNAPEVKLDGNVIWFKTTPAIKSDYKFYKGRYSETIEPGQGFVLLPLADGKWSLGMDNTRKTILVYDYYDKNLLQMAAPSGGSIIWKRSSCK